MGRDNAMANWIRDDVLPGNYGTIPSLQVGQVDINDRWDFEPGYELATQQVTSDSDYNAEPHLIRCPNEDLLLIYRKGADEAENTGRIVQQRSTDWKTGQPTWSSATEIANDSSFDTRNQQVGVDYDAGRLLVFYRVYDVPNDTNKGVFYRTSDDNGNTWSSRTDVSGKLTNARAPFGHPVKTESGWMQVFYVKNYIELLYSTDGFQTWGSFVTAADTSGNADVDAQEPIPVVVPQPDGKKDHVLILGRDTQDTQQYYLKSTDSGATWTGATDFDLRIGGNPIWPFVIGDNDMGVATFDRNTPARMLRFYRVSAQSLWNDASILENTNYKAVFRGETTGSNSEFGYASPLILGPDHPVLTWHARDGSDTDTEIYLSSAKATGNQFPYMAPVSGELETPTNLKFTGGRTDKGQIFTPGTGTGILNLLRDVNVNNDVIQYDESNEILTIAPGTSTSFQARAIIDPSNGGSFTVSSGDLTNRNGSVDGEIAKHDGTGTPGEGYYEWDKSATTWYGIGRVSGTTI